jgi:hypothetical protein
MWDKYFKIAERQFFAGKRKNLESHALKALKAARDAENPFQILKTLALLAVVYAEQHHPGTKQILLELVQVSETAYGANSEELAVALKELAIYEKDQSNYVEFETLIFRAIEIFKMLPASDHLIDTFELLAEHYVESKNFERGEAFLLSAAKTCNEVYGSFSEETDSLASYYADLLRGLGRDCEAQELEGTGHACQSCGDHAEHPDEVEPILEAVTQKEQAGNLDDGIRATREALPKMFELLNAKRALTSKDDPFVEIKLRAFSSPHRWLKSSLAQLLRAKSEQAERPDQELLLEARTLLAEVMAEAPTQSDEMHMMLTLLDLADTDASFYGEFDQLVASMEPCAAVKYSIALSLFKRHGSTSYSRVAMRDALRSNPYVPLLLGNGFDPADVPNHFSLGGKDEALGYCLEAMNQWFGTPQATEFMIEALGGSLPSSTRRMLDELAPPVPV